MKILTLVIALAVGFTAAVAFAQSAPTAPPAHGIEAELAALTALSQRPPPPGATRPELMLKWDELCRELSAEAYAVYRKYPDDPRRWHAAEFVRQPTFRPRFITSLGENFEQTGEKGIKTDAVAAAAWQEKISEVEAAFASATDVPADIRERNESMALSQNVLVAAYRATMEEKKTPDWAAVESALRAHLAKWPESDAMGHLSFYIRLHHANGNTDEVAVLQKFADSPNRAVRDYVAARLRFFELSKHPLEMAFTALDGREVDLQKLRGKVVLIDFWATWCGPCIAELPNLKRVYAQYHERGFEVVGISLDHERDRKKFINLVAKEEIAWPQHFDGNGWRNKYALEYTVMAIPAMLLIDQEGRLVSTDARGEKLETEVKRLLRL